MSSTLENLSNFSDNCACLKLPKLKKKLDCVLNNFLVPLLEYVSLSKLDDVDPFWDLPTGIPKKKRE
jgi:hypothetical protein